MTQQEKPTSPRTTCVCGTEYIRRHGAAAATPSLDVAALLRRYGRHDSACYYATGPNGASAMPCRCGWNDVLTKLESCAERDL